MSVVPFPFRHPQTNLAQLDAIGARAGAEGELCEELHRSLRLRMFDRLGTNAALDDLEAARRLEARAGIPRRAP